MKNKMNAATALGPTPWVGKLHHGTAKCDDWGCVRDEAGDRIMTISIPDRTPSVLSKHRLDKTDPTQQIIDCVLAALNKPR